MLTLRHFLTDYFTGFIVETDRRQLLHGRHPGRDGDLNVDIYWMHRGESMSKIIQKLGVLETKLVALKIRTAKISLAILPIFPVTGSSSRT